MDISGGAYTITLTVMIRVTPRFDKFEDQTAVRTACSVISFLGAWTTRTVLSDQRISVGGIADARIPP